MSSLPITRACPECQALNSVELVESSLRCKQESCSFHVNFCCPVCDFPLESLELKKDDSGDYYSCAGCRQEIHLKRVQNLINNMMMVSQEDRCPLCNGPTIYRTEANMGHRCFYFPKCSGQATLFGAPKESIVFLDFETSGLDFTRDHIIEIGALKIDPEGFEYSYDTFINPQVPLSDKIIQITKITDDMLKDAPLIDDVISSFSDFIGSSIIVAHNAEFDVPWLIHAFNKVGHSLSDNRIICTLKWARLMKEGRASLGALTKKYKIGHLNAHRALADAAVTKELFFIYDRGQTVDRPVESLDVYQKIVDKTLASRRKLGVN